MYTPGSSNIAGWKMGGPELKMYFLFKNGDIPACYVSVYQRVLVHKNIQVIAADGYGSIPEVLYIYVHILLVYSLDMI